MRAELYDAGTRLLKGNHGGGSLLDIHAKPGMQFGSFREINFEYDHRNATERILEINEKLLDEPTRTELQPWPVPFPARMWMDNTPRYEADDGGPTLTVYHQDIYAPHLFEPVPGGSTQLVDLDRKEEVHRADARVSTMPDADRIAAVNPSPTEWLRLDLENEMPGFTNLAEQQVMMHHTDKEGGRVTLSCDYNPITTPFNLREPSWYKVLNSDGEVVADTPEDVAKLLTFDPEGHYRFYLRPAKWRNVMTVVAHYVYISWFEYFPTDQIFTQAYLHRPPVYPKRHDILHVTHAFTVNGVPHGYDEAMNIQWEQTQAAAIMAHMIIDAQYYTLSSALIFAGNDPGSLVATLYPPEDDDVVLGIGRVDYPGGAEEVLWLRQVGNGEALDPTWAPTTLDVFYVPWFVTPQDPGV